MFVTSVLLVCPAVVDRTAPRASQAHDAGLFDPGRDAVDQGNGAAGAPFFTGMTAHALVVDPETSGFSGKPAGVDGVQRFGSGAYGGI